MILFPILATVYARPAFFSINFWMWPTFYMMLGLLFFAGVSMGFKSDMHDLTISSLVGLNFGVMLGIVSSVTPYYLLIFSIIPLVLYMVKG